MLFSVVLLASFCCAMDVTEHAVSSSSFVQLSFNSHRTTMLASASDRITRIADCDTAEFIAENWNEVTEFTLLSSSTENTSHDSMRLPYRRPMGDCVLAIIALHQFQKINIPFPYDVPQNNPPGFTAGGPLLGQLLIKLHGVVRKTHEETTSLIYEDTGGLGILLLRADSKIDKVLQQLTGYVEPIRSQYTTVVANRGSRSRPVRKWRASQKSRVPPLSIKQVRRCGNDTY